MFQYFFSFVPKMSYSGSKNSRKDFSTFQFLGISCFLFEFFHRQIRAVVEKLRLASRPFLLFVLPFVLICAACYPYLYGTLLLFVRPLPYLCGPLPYLCGSLSAFMRPVTLICAARYPHLCDPLPLFVWPA